MIIFKEANALARHLAGIRRNGDHIGFVPTMGALHQGHLSLIRQSRNRSAVTVASIFVNPTQFNDLSDFEKYPVTTATDIRLLTSEGTDILFLPSVAEIYPGGTKQGRDYDLGYLETILEGAHRPGHFQGVCQVVHRLLDIVAPDQLYLGQKDFQQCMVLKRLVQLLEMPVEVVIGETVREADGLAMSSRNLRLSPGERRNATAIYRSLQMIEQSIDDLPVGELQKRASQVLLENNFNKVDYIAIAEAETLRLLPPGEVVEKKRPLVALAAAFMGEVRLIDNLVLN